MAVARSRDENILTINFFRHQIIVCLRGSSGAYILGWTLLSSQSSGSWASPLQKHFPLGKLRLTTHGYHYISMTLSYFHIYLSVCFYPITVMNTFDDPCSNNSLPLMTVECTVALFPHQL